MTGLPPATNDNDKLWLGSARGTKINSSDPPLPAVCTAYPAEPLLTLLDPPIELPSPRRHGRLHLDRRIYLPAICSGDLLQVIVAEVHI